jgi:CheY-like chemotaxis protein
MPGAPVENVACRADMGEGGRFGAWAIGNAIVLARPFADRKRALDAGFDAHMAKPVDIDSLVEELTALRPKKA